MSITLFRQGDPRWSANILGNNTDPAWNLGKVGCLISDEAMLVVAATGDASWTPARMNDFVRANGGFDGGLLRWPIIPKLFPFLEDHGKHTDSAFLADAAAWVKDAPNYAILEVDGGVHYVLLYQAGAIADPIDGKSKKWGTAGYNYTSARFYRITGGQGGGQVAAPVNAGANQVYIDQAVYQDFVDRKRDWETVTAQLADVQAKLNASLADAAAWKQNAAILRKELDIADAVAAAAVPIPAASVPVTTNVVSAAAPLTGVNLAQLGPAGTAKTVDAITATERLHSGASQTYGLLKKLNVWFKALVLK